MSLPIHVMIVDDDQEDIDFLKLAFTSQAGNATFTECTDGQLAVNYMANAEKAAAGNPAYPDVIFLDLDMPNKHGYQTLQELKSNRNYALIPVMVISSTFLPKEQDRCLDAGCERFYTKPMSMEEYEQTARDTIKFLLAGLPSKGAAQTTE